MSRLRQYPDVYTGSVISNHSTTRSVSVVELFFVPLNSWKIGRVSRSLTTVCIVPSMVAVS
jgi:hypothetical protein